MQTPDIEPAPFAPGDRVIYRPHPAGIETIESVEYIEKGWAGWYVATRRDAGPTGQARGLKAHDTQWRYARAEEFDPATSGFASAPPPITCRRSALVIAALAALGWLVILCGVFMELPS